MKITYVRLENVAGLYVGLDRDFIEINFQNSENKIVSIMGENGVGKTVLLSSLTPFASVTSLDERSSLPYILPGKNGFKQIEYQDGDNHYVIKHYYKSTKDSHSVKSYLQLNGEELNENGNVTSFLSLVELHMGITPEMMRLVRLGSNVNSFLTLSSAERKSYIGRLIEEVELYLKIYKKINEDIRVVKVLMSSNHTNLYNCHILDLVGEEEKLKKLNKQVKEYEKERDQIVSQIGKIQALEKENNIDDLKRKRQEAEASLAEFNRTEESIQSLSLEKVTMDQLMNKRTDMMNKRIDAQSKINSYKISIDTTLKNIERLEISVKKVTSSNDVQSLITAIDNLKDYLKDPNPMIKGFIAPECTSEEVFQIITKLSSFNQISHMIHTFGNRPSCVYLKLRRGNKPIDEFLRDQMKRNLSRVSDNDLKRLFSQVFKEDEIITPNCDTQFVDCPYYRLSEMITEFKDKLEEEVFDDETLRYIQVISNNIDNMLNEIDRLSTIKIPDKLKDIMKEKNILSRLESKLSFFDLSGFHEYHLMFREYEIYKHNIEKLKHYEHQLSIFKISGIDSQLEEIKVFMEYIDFYNSNISTLGKELGSIASKLEEIDYQIGLVTKYIDGKKYRKIVEATLESTNKILIPLESSTGQKIELTYKLNSLNDSIALTRDDVKQLENKINEYVRLVKESEFLSQKHKDLNINGFIL